VWNKILQNGITDFILEPRTAENGGKSSTIVLKNEYVLARYDVLTARFLKVLVVWHVTPYRLVSSFRRFKGTQYLYHKGQAVEEDYFTLKMEALRSRETSVTNRRYGAT
jgi:hypothetical protein